MRSPLYSSLSPIPLDGELPADDVPPDTGGLERVACGGDFGGPVLVEGLLPTGGETNAVRYTKF